jgi:hypothetical protein
MDNRDKSYGHRVHYGPRMILSTLLLAMSVSLLCATESYLESHLHQSQNADPSPGPHRLLGALSGALNSLRRKQRALTRLVNTAVVFVLSSRYFMSHTYRRDVSHGSFCVLGRMKGPDLPRRQVIPDGIQSLYPILLSVTGATQLRVFLRPAIASNQLYPILCCTHFLRSDSFQKILRDVAW